MKINRLQLGYLLYVGLVIFASLIPGRGLEGVGIWDKVGHFLAYALLAFFGLVVFDSRSSRLASIGFALILGIALEYSQQYFAGREPSLADGIANVLGVTSGVILNMLAYRKRSDQPLS